jgi:hypothetical protein
MFRGCGSIFPQTMRASHVNQKGGGTLTMLECMEKNAWEEVKGHTWKARPWDSRLVEHKV